jgi:hypothetical protein
LEQLPTEQQDQVLNLAVKNRKVVLKERKEEDQMIAKQRRENLVQAHRKRLALQQRYGISFRRSI